MISNIEKKISKNSIDAKKFPEEAKYMNENPKLEQIFNLFSDLSEIEQLMFDKKINKVSQIDQSILDLTKLKQIL